MIYLFDKKLNLKKIVNEPLEAIQEWELNNLITLDAVIPYDESYEGYFYIGHKLNNEFFVYAIRNEIKEDNTLKIKGVHILFDELKGVIINDRRYLKGENSLTVLKETLIKSGWEVDGIGEVANFKGNFYYESVLSSFNKVLEYTNLQYRPVIEFTNNKISKKVIKVSTQIGQDYGKWFEYGDKLVSVIAEQSYEDVYTAFIGRGKGLPTLDEEGRETGGYGRRLTIKDVDWKVAKGDPIDKPIGQEFIEIKEATEIYGYPNGKPKTYVKIFENIEDEKELIKATYDYAIENSRPKIQMKAIAISDKPVEIGEIVTVINPKMNIRYKTTIFKIKMDLISGLQEFEFGEKIALSGVERTIKQEKRNEERLQEVKSIFMSRLENMGLDFFKKDGFPIVLEANNKYNLPGGFYVLDRPIDRDPQSFVGIGGDGIIFANSKNSDGNWKIQTAIDGKGIAGESIVSNSITANKLSADVGQSLDLSSNVSVNNTVRTKIIDLKNEIAEDITSRIKTSTEGITLEVNKRFENIKIGGVNLAKNSKYLNDNYWEGYELETKRIHKITSNDRWNGFKKIVFYDVKPNINSLLACYYDLRFDTTFKKGQEYVISFLAKNYDKFSITFYMKGFEKTNRVTLKRNEEKRIVLRGVKGSEEISQIAVERERWYHYVEFAIAELMVEEGTIPTAWSLSPDEKVNKDEIISSINLSPEKIKIKSKNIELDGETVATSLTSQKIYGAVIEGGTIQGNSKIKIGTYGYFRPNSSGFVAVAPESEYANKGIGMQLSGNDDSSPSGIFLFESNNIAEGGTHEISQKELLTVWGANTMAFKYKGRWRREGKAICTNKTMNSEIRFNNVNMFAISSICYGDDGELYFDDGTDGDLHGWFVKVDKNHSDIRLKKNIKVCKEKGLDLIKKIKFKSFDWKKKTKQKQKKHTKIGIIAQELEKLDDSLVYTEPNGTKCIDDFRMLNVSLKAIQELNSIVESQQKEIDDLKNQIKILLERAL